MAGRNSLPSGPPAEPLGVSAAARARVRPAPGPDAAAPAGPLAPPVSGPVRNALTIDVEDYFNVTGFESRLRKASWRFFESQTPRNVDVILGMLEPRRVRATFFFLGWIARQFPGLVRQVRDAGHEIGCHGYWHQRVFTQTREQFRADLVSSRDLLEDLTGAPVRSYRAPSFSIHPHCRWAFETLCETGFTVDSSVQPPCSLVAPAVVPLVPYRVRTASGVLTEYPLPAARRGRLTFPVGGGGYFRFLPYEVTRFILRQINREGRAFISYIHPWEFDPDQARFFVGPGRYFKHYFNLAALPRKYERMLDDFAFTTLGEIDAGLAAGAAGPEVVLTGD